MREHLHEQDEPVPELLIFSPDSPFVSSRLGPLLSQALLTEATGQPHPVAVGLPFLAAPPLPSPPPQQQ